MIDTVSKRRFRQYAGAKNKKAGFLLLVLCMAAVSQSPNAAAYQRAKHCLHLLESQDMISMPLLQSAIMIGFYELSSAIYPAAFLTVGHCARLGQAMGVHDRKNAPQLFKSPSRFLLIILQ